MLSQPHPSITRRTDRSKRTYARRPMMVVVMKKEQKVSALTTRPSPAGAMGGCW
jgi:hypothetical protein